MNVDSRRDKGIDTVAYTPRASPVVRHVIVSVKNVAFRKKKVSVSYRTLDPSMFPTESWRNVPRWKGDTFRMDTKQGEKTIMEWDVGTIWKHERNPSRCASRRFDAHVEPL